MSWNKTVQEVPEQVPEGTYSAYISKISENSSIYGAMVVMEFTLASNDEFDGRQVNGVCRPVINQKSKLGRWIAAIIGRTFQVGEEIKEEDILHRACRIVVKHTQKKNQVTIFANVIDVLPAEELSNSPKSDLPF